MGWAEYLRRKAAVMLGGQTMTEYALIMLSVSLVAAGAYFAVGQKIGVMTDILINWLNAAGSAL